MKFNENKKTTLTENLAGGEAYEQSDKLKIVSILLTSFVKDSFYRSENDTIEELKKLIKNTNDKKFVAKASIYARNEFGMRSITHIAAGEIAKAVKGEQWTKNYFDKVVYRVDDILEILSYYMNNYKKPLPNSMKKGLRKSFDKFDDYQIAKYQKGKAKLSLIDAVNLLKPIPTSRNKNSLKLLVDNKLVSTDTWETKLTQAGQKATSEEEKDQFKKDAWTSLIKERKIGYFALLRNLRNILEQAPELIDEANAMLTDRNLIKSSLVLPFRYTTAMDEIKKTNSPEARKIVMALDKAIDISCDNVPLLEGNTVVVLDVSSSMNSISNISSLFTAILLKKNNCDFITFDGDARYKIYNPNDSVSTIAKSFSYTGGSTDFKSIFPIMSKKYDRVIILSDMQGWVGYHSPKIVFNEYKKKFGANPHVYSFDLAGHGTMQFPENNVYALAGFSDKVFDIMKLLETDKKALINTIEKVEL